MNGSVPISSPYEVSVLDSIHEAGKNQWNHVVTEADRGSVFHRHEWLAAVERGLDHEPRHVVVRKGGNPIGVFPNFATEFDLPYDLADSLATAVDATVVTSSSPGYGGPVVITDERTCLDAMFDALTVENGQRVVYHLVRTYDAGHIRYGQFLQARGYELSAHECLISLSLGDDPDAVVANMAKERRKAMRRARDQEHRVEIAPLGDDVGRTYEQYARNMERVDGTTLPRAFLEALAETFEDRVRVFTAIVDGEEVGRYVFVLDEERSVIHHWLSAIPDESQFDSYPSELLHGRAIEWGIEHGFDGYNFGPTRSHFGDSVFRFKEKYGGRATPVLNWQKGGSLTWPLYKLGRRRHLKSAL